ncbi:hypothetical protein H2204_004220 [Knufia peltigerae]|uniref:FAD-binding domain-containing protein n=1 Tax=Knufia peltigerae TaxID=1002370 RepID=A0AA38Y9G3_9EURO|nr:hypothetical protein H2204_004220 [Knufia peltigerae]
MSAQHPILIAIVGGGIAGMSLARIIAQEVHATSSSSGSCYPFSITIFDRDLSPSDPVQRPQGGQLDLHADSGQLAIKAAGIWDCFTRKAHYDAQGWRVDDCNGQMAAQVTEEEGKARDKPEIGRGHLRRLLTQDVETVDNVQVRWGQKVVNIVSHAAGFQIVVGGHEETPDSKVLFDLVVGADGTWSRTRELVSAPDPVYSGMTIVETNISPATESQQTSAMVGKGSYMAVAFNKALMAQRNADGGIRVYIALTVPETWATASGLDWSDPTITKETILNRFFTQWSDSVKNVVRDSKSSEMRLWPLYDTLKPTEGGRWRTNLGATLLGDAAHVMPPWTGRGANMAMLDALGLGKKMGQALSGAEEFDVQQGKAEVLESLRKSMREYEETMWLRMEKEKDENRQSHHLLFGEDSPKSFHDMMKQQALPQA